MEKLPAWLPKPDPVKIKETIENSVLLYIKYKGGKDTSIFNDILNSDGVLCKTFETLSQDDKFAIGESLTFFGLKVAKDFVDLSGKHDSEEGILLLQNGALTVMAGNLLFSNSTEQTQFRKHMESLNKEENEWYPGWDDTSKILQKAVPSSEKTTSTQNTFFSCSKLE